MNRDINIIKTIKITLPVAIITIQNIRQQLEKQHHGLPRTYLMNTIL